MIVDPSQLVVAGIADPSHSSGSPCFARIKRSFFSKRFGWNLRGNRAVVSHTHDAIISHAANFRARHVPFLENFPHEILFSALGNDQHALLRFAQHDLIRRHARLALWHFRQINFDSAASAARGLTGRAGQTGCAHVLDARNCIASDQFKARFQQQFFEEGVADLDGGTIFARLLGQFARCKSCACETVTACLGAYVKHRIATALCGAARQLFMAQHAEAENVYQRIALEAFVEIDLAADCWNAHAIPVMRDARDYAGKKPPVGG